MDTDNIFDQPPAKPLTKHQADHLQGQVFLWCRGLISDDQAFDAFRHYKMPLLATLTKLVGGVSALVEEEE